MSSTLYQNIFHWAGYLCGQTPDRSPFIGDWQFFLCWRCTGIYSFLLLCMPLACRKKIRLTREFYIRNLSYIIAASLVMGMDVFFLQRFFPNNMTRFATGALLGGALSMFVCRNVKVLIQTPQFYGNRERRSYEKNQ